MSDIFGAPRQPEPEPVDRRRRVLIPTLITMAVLLFLGSIFTGVWTNRLWYQSLGFSDVYYTMLFTRIGMFVVVGLLFAGVVAANVLLAYRFRPVNPVRRRDDPATRYRVALEPIKIPVLIVGAIVLTVFAGSVGQSRWSTFQVWRNATPFGIEDPQFGKDQSFYVFTLPWLQFVSSLLFTMIVVAVLASLFVHYVYGAIRFANRKSSVSRAAQVHLSILVGLGVAERAWAYWLERYLYLTKSGGVADGALFTDVNSRIPSRNILVGVAIVCALLFLVAVFIRSWVLPGIALTMMLVTSVLIGGIWPYVMQSFQVKPSEPNKEAPYIARNIEATREAYGVNEYDRREYSAKTELTPRELTASSEERVSARLLDPTLVAPAFEQLQQVRGYYTVPTTLDVDRYRLGDDEQPSDVIIAARELSLDGLPASQRNWANDHTVYTHGYGVIAARGNQRGENGDPVWVEKDIPPEGQIPTKIPPRIYYGENSPTYSIVGRPEGAAPVEIDVPRGSTGESDDVAQNTYDGKGGVEIGSMFNRLLYAFKFAEPNIVLSDRVNENSKILYDRDPRQRVSKAAPWLTVDADPYPAIVDGRVTWVIDGYTTSNSYAYSQHRSLRTATADTLTQQRSQAILPADDVNYIRNSVKATVDALDGTVTLYQWDTEDPVLKTWMKVFPDSVTPKAEISDSLKEHLRYPVDLFKVQRDILTRYHVTDPQKWYNGDEQWKIPEDPAVSGGGAYQPPYYLSIARPGQDTPQFSLTTVYLPNNRENLISFMSVNSEASDENYGKLQILELPSTTQIDGPSQIANSFSADTDVQEALRPFRQSDATVLYGNLLTLPVGDALLYVQPVYIRRSSAAGSYPVLQFVTASFGQDGKVGFGQSLDEALRVAVGLQEGDTSDSTADEGDSGGGDTAGSEESGGSEATTTREYLAQASRFYNQAQEALREGDLSTYQRRIEQMNSAIRNAQEALPADQ